MMSNDIGCCDPQEVGETVGAVDGEEDGDSDGVDVEGAAVGDSVPTTVDAEAEMYELCQPSTVTLIGVVSMLRFKLRASDAVMPLLPRNVSPITIDPLFRVVCVVSASTMMLVRSFTLLRAMRTNSSARVSPASDRDGCCRLIRSPLNIMVSFITWLMPAGDSVGLVVGLIVGLLPVGDVVGPTEGVAVGFAVGLAVGLAVGCTVGLAVGLADGLAVG